MALNTTKRGAYNIATTDNKVRRTSAIKLSAAVFSAALLAVLLVPSVAWATPASDKQAEADAALAQLNGMQSKLNEAENTYFQAQQEHDEAQARATEAQEQIDSATLKIALLRDTLKNRARSMYRSGASTMLDVLFGSSSFQEFTNNWELLDMMNKDDSKRINETKKLRAEVEVNKVILDKENEKAEIAEAEARDIYNDAKATEENMKSIYDNLSAEAAQLLNQQRAAEEAANAAYDGGYSGGGYDYNPDDFPPVGGDVLSRAWAEVGVADYVWGACDPYKHKFDCSGFVSYCLTGTGSRLGTTYTFLARYPQVIAPVPGDIAVNEEHCGIYIGNGQMIHAPQSGERVKVGPVQRGMVFVRYPG